MRGLGYPFLLIVLCLASFGCADKPGEAAADSAKLLKQGKWKLQSMTLNGKSIPPLAAADITISFKQNRFFGSSGCNSYDGTYVAKKGGQFSVGEISATEMACLDPPGVMQVEMDYHNVLSKVNAFSRTGKQLILSDGTANNRAVFVPYQAPAPLPLAGTRWTLNTFEESDSVSVSATPVLDNAAIDLLIEDGKASGAGGCNRYQAQVTTGKGTLTFGGLSMTKKACAPEIMQQETRFSAALQKISRYEISGNQLRLYDADDTLALHFSAE